jgi:hypothetical protein
MFYVEQSRFNVEDYVPRGTNVELLDYRQRISHLVLSELKNRSRPIHGSEEKG